MSRRVMLRVAWLGCALALPGAASGASWSSVRIVPADIHLSRPGDSQRILVLARPVEPGALEEDVTSRCGLKSVAQAIASVESGPAVSGKSPGRTAVEASCEGLRASVGVSVGSRASEVAVRFSPDVISVLTIKGCNNSSCHGSPVGQNGFKLSLFGYDPAADHQMIVAGHNGRRVDKDQPAQSLLLRKPLFEIAHGGGRLMTRDSEEYRTILRWLEQGARPESGGGVRLTRLEIYPGEQVLIKGTKARLVAMGRLSDGTTRDMTAEVRYSSSDEAVAAVSPDGVVTAGTNGLASIMARGLGSVAAAQTGVVPERAGTDFPALPRSGSGAASASRVLDELVHSKRRRLNVRPAPLSSDHEFVRRVYLDTIGLPPKPEEAEQFAADSRSDKRARLIDALLERPEYESFWTVKFEDWFRNNQLNSQGRSMGKFKEWLREWLAGDKPYDRMVREILTSEGDTFQQPATNFWHPAADFMLKKFDVKKVTPTVSRLFLGIRMECAECHNHPLENFTQDDFYGLSAFFARMRVKHGTAEYRRTWYLDEEGEVEHPVTKQVVPAKFLSPAHGGRGDTASTPRFGEGEDRRTALAAWVTSPANPYFARATVNRIWNEYFQTGIVEPFDDFRSTNPPTNAALLDRLAAYFVEQGYRFKPLHRVILNSRTYQLSSRRSKEEAQPSLDRLLFARYEPRKLSAEVLLDSISQVTGRAHSFRNYPEGTRAMDVDVPDAPDYFLVTFGLPRRDIICERAESPTLGQALHMINGETVAQKVTAKDNILGGWMEAGRTDEAIAEAIFLRAYSRRPSDEELGSVRDFIAGELRAGRSRRRALEGVLWTVLNSKEFQVNH